MDSESIGPLTKAQLALAMYPDKCNECALTEHLSDLQAWAQLRGIDWETVIANLDDVCLESESA